jgi:uncharacterized protein (DUF302 family)
MGLESFGTPGYGMTKVLTDISFEDTVARVTARLGKNGFGVLTHIDVQTTLRNKIGADIPRYTVLGACNPTLAHQALEMDPGFGLLMPCSVVVSEQGDGSIAVSIAEPASMFKALERTDLGVFAARVRAPLKAALDSL